MRRGDELGTDEVEGEYRIGPRARRSSAKFLWGPYAPSHDQSKLQARSLKENCGRHPDPEAA